MTRAFSAPYGAFELKSRYQLNMLMGTGFSIAVTGLIIFSAWLYGVIIHEEAIEDRGVIIKQIIDIGPPPSIERTRPQLDIKNPGVKAPAVGIPTPVDNDEVAEEASQMLTREDKKAINTPDLGSGDKGGGVDIVIEIPVDEIEPPEKFVIVEEQPVLVYEEMPVYPRIPMEGGFTGWVIVQAFVDKHGIVLKAEAVKCNRPGMGFEEAAVSAAMKNEYRPAIQNGNPIGLWISYKVVFTL